MSNKAIVELKVPLYSNIKIEPNKNGTTVARLFVRKNSKIIVPNGMSVQTL